MTYRSDLSNPFDYNVFGIITGTAGARFPDVPAQLARLGARSTNIGSFFIGNQSGSAYTTWELDAGWETDWFGIDNLNKLYGRNPSGTVDYLAYWIQK